MAGCNQGGGKEMEVSNPYESPKMHPTPLAGIGWSHRTRWLLAGSLFTAIHFGYATCFGLLVNQRPGGYVWSSLPWAPGFMLIYWSGELVGPSPLIGAGLCFLVGGSILAGILAMQAVRGSSSDAWNRRYGLMFWLALLTWSVWLPVPFRGTLLLV
jgi:hypothetical protein